MSDIKSNYEEYGMGCTLSGPGRGDCMHFVGLPGKSIPGKHDGPDDTLDCYGKPNGWCWSCWKDYKLETAKAELLTWAVSRWILEVKDCPLVNIHRRSLDDTWRQVIRYAGGNDRELIGPTHDELIKRS